ncbi:MAG: 2-oxo acid dehydrogenase subunit E2 [Acidimicrobiia bacterium]|jgi:pyruvate/2-oxoglutarate dehydrogenase complex dihydrolipoamide acyltransferase (E2) component
MTTREPSIANDNERQRTLTRRAFPPSRRFVTGALEVGRRITPMHGLIEIDVTEPSRALEETGLSFTAFVVASVGRAAALHPEVHAYRDWAGRLVVSNFVDVTALIEVQTDTGPFPLAHLIRDADIRSVPDITREIREVQRSRPGDVPRARLDGLAGTAGRIPGVPRLFYRLMSRSSRLRRMAGTVTVTSIGMLAGGSGHGVPFPTVFSLSILVGGRSRRPVADGDEVTIRDILDLTVTVDHRTVDGGPASRFVSDLRRILGNAGLLI